jgi:hypothetical protein
VACHAPSYRFAFAPPLSPAPDPNAGFPVYFLHPCD